MFSYCIEIMVVKDKWIGHNNNTIKELLTLLYEWKYFKINSIHQKLKENMRNAPAAAEFYFYFIFYYKSPIGVERKRVHTAQHI